MKAKVIFTETGKICTQCDRDLPLADYYPNGGGRPGFHAECRQCFAVRTSAHYQANKERKHAKNAEWRAANPARQKAIIRRSNLKRHRGITVEQYEAMLVSQCGRCAGCGTSDSGDRRFDTFSVDHDHQTGKIRGLLCSRCNKALGLLDDDPDRLMSLVAYLLQHSDVLGEVTSA